MLCTNIELAGNDFKTITFDIVRPSCQPFVMMAALRTNVPMSQEDTILSLYNYI